MPWKDSYVSTKYLPAPRDCTIVETFAPSSAAASRDCAGVGPISPPVELSAMAAEDYLVEAASGDRSRMRRKRMQSVWLTLKYLSAPNIGVRGSSKSLRGTVVGRDGF